MTAPKIPTAPKHLSAASRAWWRAVLSEYAIEAHLLRVLTAAAESWDRMQEARERITADGAYLADRFGALRSHPAITVERDSRIAFARLVRELGLEVGNPDGRPPRVGGART